MTQISKILIGMVFVTLIVTGMVLFLVGGAEEYGATDYNDSSLNRLENSFEEVLNLTNETQKELQDVKEKEDSNDLLGVFFSGGYKGAKVVTSSYDTLNEMNDVAMDELGLGAFGETLKLAVGAIILIVIFIMILMHFLIKSDRL